MYEFEEGSRLSTSDPLSGYTLPKLLFAAWNFSDREKWGNDFEQDILRLNSPEIIDFYEKENFRSTPDRVDTAKYPKKMWEDKFGY